MSDAKPMPVTLLTWKAIDKGSLWGVADVQLGAMKINGVMVFRKDDGSTWAMLPSKASVKADGTVYTGSDGKVKYTPVVEWANRETGERFSAAVIAAVKQFIADN